MTKVINKSKIAAALVGALAIAGSATAAAQSISTLQNEEAKIHEADVRSQEKINSLFEQSQELLYEYRGIVDEYEQLKVYNDHVQRLVDDQNAQLASLQRQIDSVEDTKQGVVPLMYKMIDALEQFVKLDIPIHRDSRLARVERLRDIMSNANVTTSEQFRQITEAYQAEMDYGSGLIAYEGKLEFGGEEISVDFFHLGRAALMAQSLDLKNGWIFNDDTNEWEVLDDAYLSALTKAIRMARKQTAPDLLKLPIYAAERAE
ncbi:DUF3450 domain-containing protein [Pseudidiomarina terrestris]|uniref:DUF3450 domain-containing protein n=1 Tax=Pseudidiomarina terrestris TaxID=2820060 RepID=A0AAW7QUI8_9GAMM|nr:MULTISPECIES: DUF3450 domain-containing protein [unclassified Pseudidiomarina]MDN7123389.1 DUF3450 domain-containing protein [Pseudidiomarina sp. 1APP75-32.1]MDN7127779.1 DUF3450 domain-containing protein [Pseudidiomarina sp. 1APR75-33.1]MDN7128886.1 DUF3450 domain-containing protein [Pseudidiomarina sp. 1APR75-15]MDN7134851.1 DUF3450 domain-containing protein [Pseudidiomarina sp. 1ASP75-5]MEA3587361.1 DUF3450 domain-containing protein [Pseudidiomarina sp. 1APP75-27a]